ncbi:MAG: hypothetical protein V4735_01825 [Pseudomonadota bacterium]
MAISPKPTDPTPNGTFAEGINFDTVYESIAKKGIQLSAEEKGKLKTICLEELKDNDGGVLSSLGITNIMHAIFAFVQNLFNGSDGVGLNNIGTHLGQTATKTRELNKLRQLDTAAQRIDIRLRNAGGNLAAAASLVSGQTLASDPTPYDVTAANSIIYSQLRARIDLPANATSSLNPGSHYAEFVPPLPTPNKSPLTARGLSA